MLGINLCEFISPIENLFVVGEFAIEPIMPREGGCFIAGQFMVSHRHHVGGVSEGDEFARSLSLEGPLIHGY